MNDKQQRFAEEYLIASNAPQAAIQAAQAEHRERTKVALTVQARNGKVGGSGICWPMPVIALITSALHPEADIPRPTLDFRF